MTWASPGHHNNSLWEGALLLFLLNTAEFEWSHSDFAIIFLLPVKGSTLTFLDELICQIRLHDVNKLLLSNYSSNRLKVIHERSKRSSCSKRCIFLQPKLKERVVQFLLRPACPLIGGLGQSNSIDFPHRDTTALTRTRGGIWRIRKAELQSL